MSRDIHCPEVELNARAMAGLNRLVLAKLVVKVTGVLVARVEPVVLVSLSAMSAAAGEQKITIYSNIISNPIISHLCRVSFHSVKDSSSAGGQTATSSDHDHHAHHNYHHRHHFHHHSHDEDDNNDKEDKDLTSSSLPTPPPPPLQEQTNTLLSITKPGILKLMFSFVIFKDTK